MRTHAIAIALILLIGVPGSASADPVQDGETLFVENCAQCHGPAAKGDGPLASGLDTQPPDLSKIAERRDGVWPMLEIMSVIDGYSKRTITRPDMPVFEHLSDGPKVDFDTGNGILTPTPTRLINLTTYLESIQSPAPTRYVP